MPGQYNEFLNILQAMENEKVNYVLVGGFAIILHGMHRHTMDIDVFVENEQENIRKLRKALYSLYHDPDIEEITYQELKEYPVIRYGTPTGTIIDIMTNQGEVIAYDDLEFENVEIDGQKIKIATPETLLKMKGNTVRPHDKLDSIFCKQLIQNR
jgi:hypothetical protein